MDVKIEKKKGLRGIKPRYWVYGSIAAAVLGLSLIHI